jgi:DNA-binding NarL/FixJ family response regulator
MTVRREIAEPRRETSAQSPENPMRTRAVRGGARGEPAARRLVVAADRRLEQKCSWIVWASLHLLAVRLVPNMSKRHKGAIGLPQGEMLSADLLKRKPRILLADDQCIVAAGVSKLLEQHYNVVGIVESGRMLLKAAQQQRPDIIVLEVFLPQLNGLDASRQLRKLMPASKLVFLTTQACSAVVSEAFQVGASAYVLKRSSPAVLSQAIQAAMNGQKFVCPLVTQGFPTSGANGQERVVNLLQSSSLTCRQREVLQLIAEDQGTKEIATLLNIAVKTVEFHKFKIMEQLDLHSSVALTKFALTEGLVSL